MRSRALLVGIGVGLAFTFLVVSTGNTMPGFARRYRMSCQTCHAPFPKLKPYGDEFAANGFSLPDKEMRGVDINTGDDMLVLTRFIPIGFRIDLYGTYEHDSEPTNDIKAPFNLKIISGGPISKKVSYYFYFFLSERGEIAGLEDAFIYVKDLFGSGLNFTMGQFSMADPIIKGELRLTRENYQIFKIKPGDAKGNLSYERGLILDYGFEFGLDLVLTVANGNGIGAADDVYKAFDDDEFKNVMFRVSQDLGEHLRLGGFVYWGMDRRKVDSGTTDAPTTKKVDNMFTYYGGDLTALLGPFELNGVYLYRTDENPDFAPTGATSAASHGVMAELIFQPDADRSNWGVTALYNLFKSDYKVGNVENLDYHTATLSVFYLAARNVRLMAEYTYVLEQAVEGEMLENGHRATLGIIGAF